LIPNDNFAQKKFKLSGIVFGAKGNSEEKSNEIERVSER